MTIPLWLDDDSGRMHISKFAPETTEPVPSGTDQAHDSRRLIRLLLVEDNQPDARIVELLLRQVVGVTFEVVRVLTLSAAINHLAAGGFQLVLLDLGLPDSWGLDTFLKIRDYASAIPIIVRTGNSDEEVALQAIRHGAQDYLLKGADAPTLVRSIRYAMSRHRMRRKVQQSLDAMKVSESNLRMIIENNLDGNVVVDQSGLVVHANPAAETLFALPVGTFVGRPFPLKLTPGTTRETQIVNGLGQVVPTELRCGTIVWSGQPASLVLLRDLTEHQKAASARHNLELAREVQQRLLPQDSPNLNGVDIAGASVMADETGGDYFNYIPMPNGIIGLVVADASGHGIAAALLITVVSTLLHAFCSLFTDPGEVLRRVARALGVHIPEGAFVTAVLACIDPVRRTVVYASAGHPSALLIDATGTVRVDLTSLDLPIGLDPDCQFQSSPVYSLQSGEILVLISDGILEAMGHDGKLFGKRHVMEHVRQHRQESALMIVKSLIKAVRSHCAPGAPADDLTIVVAKCQ